MSTQKAATNGVAGNEQTGKETKPQKPELSNLSVAKKEEEKPQVESLEDRLHRLNQLFDLQQKHTRLSGSLQKLNEFKLKKTDENVTLRISDVNRSSDFSTSNPDVIKEVLDFIKVTIEKKKKEIEPLLKW
jgi:hypothetical protein